jgi:hypothetical protein
MVVFYLCLNTIIPLYDDVIISLQVESMKLLVGDNDPDLRMKQIKRKRMIDFINRLKDDDKLFLETEKKHLILEYCCDACDDTCECCEASDDSGEYVCDACKNCEASESQDTQESRKRQREEDELYNEVDKSINDEINKAFDITSLNTYLNTHLNTDIKNKDD